MSDERTLTVSVDNGLVEQLSDPGGYATRQAVLGGVPMDTQVEVSVEHGENQVTWTFTWTE